MTFDDEMFDFACDYDMERISAGVPEDELSLLTADFYLKAVIRFPNHHHEVISYCMSWLWAEWCSAHLPEPVITEEQTKADAARIDAVVAKIMENWPVTS